MTGQLTISRRRLHQIGVCHLLPNVQALAKTVLLAGKLSLFNVTVIKRKVLEQVFDEILIGRNVTYIICSKVMNYDV